jgi:hypothetical protein
LLNEQPEWRGKVDRSLIFVGDVRLGERIGAATDHSARMSDIQAACTQIASLWSGVQPRPSIFKKPDDEG